MSFLIYLSLGLIIFFYEINRKKSYLFDAIFFSNFFYFLFYVLTPVTCIAIPEWQNKTGLFALYIVDLNRVDLALVPFFAYIILLLGWQVGDLKKISPFNFLLSTRSEKKLIYFGFFVGIVAYMAYASSYGGIVNSLILGSSLRYGRISAESYDIGVSGVFKHFIFSLDLILLYYTCKYYEKYYSFAKDDYIIAIIAFCAVILYALSSSSRGAIITLIFSVLAVRTYNDQARLKYILTNRRNLRFFILLPIILLIILYGKQFFYALPELINGDLDSFTTEFNLLNDIRISEDTNFLRDTLMKESSHGLVSLAAAIDDFMPTGNYLFFRDYLLLPLHIVPMNLLGVSIELPPTVSVINTDLVNGLFVASSPPGMIAHLIYNMGYLGLIFIFFYGLAGKIIQNRLIKTNYSAGRNVILFYFSFFYGGYIGNADIKVYVYSAFPFFILVAFLYARKLLLFISRTNIH